MKETSSGWPGKGTVLILMCFIECTDQNRTSLLLIRNSIGDLLVWLTQYPSPLWARHSAPLSSISYWSMRENIKTLSMFVLSMCDRNNFMNVCMCETHYQALSRTWMRWKRCHNMWSIYHLHRRTKSGGFTQPHSGSHYSLCLFPQTCLHKDEKYKHSQTVCLFCPKISVFVWTWP